MTEARIGAERVSSASRKRDAGDACIDKASASPARNGDANHGGFLATRESGSSIDLQPHAAEMFGSSPVRGADQGRASLSSVTSNAKGRRIAEAAENTCAIGSVSLAGHPYILAMDRDKTNSLSSPWAGVHFWFSGRRWEHSPGAVVVPKEEYRE
ncbi:hypothetical protein [Paraburkholderia atlantica]|uniref:hypothetical protein n=1 Tax=Paraburkholderia atlantica TaxID=2654982 RepID=UPI001C3760F3|nr:hypothetical protein [Paraburkholderia atlantica]